MHWMIDILWWPELRKLSLRQQFRLLNVWQSDRLLPVGVRLVKLTVVMTIAVVSLGLMFASTVFLLDWIGMLKGYGMFLIVGIPIIVAIPTILLLYLVFSPYLCGQFCEYLEISWKGGRPRRCLACDYDLRGTSGDCCPECGEMIPTLARLLGKSDHFLPR